MIYIGIDPGKSGAIAAYESDTMSIVSLIEMPLIKGKKKSELDLIGMRTMIGSIVDNNADSSIRATIEKAQAMPKQGVVSMLSIGYGYGALCMALVCLRISFIEVRPNEWHKKILVGMPKGEQKAASIGNAQKIFPDCYNSLTTGPSGRQRKPHDGMADALNIALYGQHYFDGGGTNG